MFKCKLALTTMLAVATIGSANLTATSILPFTTNVTVHAAASDPITFNSTVYVNYTPGYSITVHSTPGGDTTGELLKDDTRWKTTEATQLADGSVWYRVGANQWIDATYAAPYRVTKMSDVAVIHYKPGYSIAVWTNPEETPFKPHEVTGTLLKDGTSWKVLAKATLEDAHVWYNLGGAQWIDSSYATLESQSTTVVFPFAEGYKGFDANQLFGATRSEGKHDGLDFGSVRYGNHDFRAITAGTVTHSGPSSEFPELLDMIVVEMADHTQVIYQEFSAGSADYHVKVNEKVTAGQDIGYMAEDHLHISVVAADGPAWNNAISKYGYTDGWPWINPQTYLKNGGAITASVEKLATTDEKVEQTETTDNTAESTVDSIGETHSAKAGSDDKTISVETVQDDTPTTNSEETEKANTISTESNNNTRLSANVTESRDKTDSGKTETTPIASTSKKTTPKVEDAIPTKITPDTMKPVEISESNVTSTNEKVSDGTPAVTAESATELSENPSIK